MTPFTFKDQLKKIRTTLNQWAGSMQAALTTLRQTKATHEGGTLDFASVMYLARGKQKILVTICIFGVLWAFMQFWAAPYVQRLEGQMSLRPAQWAQLENLIKLSKGKPLQLDTVVLVDEAELQKIRNVLIARGLKPSVLRLGVENPPRIELQASDVMFAVIVDVLEELRIGWRLYPERIELVATPSTAIVNLSASLVQTSASSYSSNVSLLDGVLSK
jgi:hypothetical protein